MPNTAHRLVAPEFSSPCPLSLEQIHLWLLDLRRVTDQHYLMAAEFMDASEQARAQSFRRGRTDYLASRWLLRQSLALYTQTAPAKLRLARTTKGKPYLADSHIHFSLSHSGHWALIAIAQQPLLGVDIEAGARKRSLLGIAQRHFHPQENRYLESLDEQTQTDYFYRLWTLKEAFLKATGAGISAGLDKLCFDIKGPIISVAAAPELIGAEQQWQFQQWRLPDGETIALAYSAAKPLQIKCFDALAAAAFP